RFSDAIGIALTFHRDLDRKVCNQKDGRVFPIEQLLRFQNLIERLRDDWNIIGRESSVGFQERPNRHDLPQTHSSLLIAIAVLRAKTFPQAVVGRARTVRPERRLPRASSKKIGVSQSGGSLRLPRVFHIERSFSSGSGGVLPMCVGPPPFVGSVLTCRAFTQDHFGTASPSLGYSSPRGLALKVSREPRRLLALGSALQKLLSQFHWPCPPMKDGHLIKRAPKGFKVQYERADKGT